MPKSSSKNPCGGRLTGLTDYLSTVRAGMENPTVIAKPITKARALQELNNVLQECFDEAYTEYNERYLHEIEVDFGGDKDED